MNTQDSRVTKVEITKPGFIQVMVELEILDNKLVIFQSRDENGDVLQPIPLNFFLSNNPFINLFKLDELLEKSTALICNEHSVNDYAAVYHLNISNEQLIPFSVDKKNHTTLFLKYTENYPPIIADLLSIETTNEEARAFAIFLIRYPIRNKKGGFFFSDMIEKVNLTRFYQPALFIESNRMSDEEFINSLYSKYHISEGLRYVRSNRRNETLDDYARHHNIRFL